MANRIFASPSPHIHSADNTRRIMGDVVLALIPALAVSSYVLGLRVLFITFVAVASCVLFEYLISRLLLKRKSTIGDLSAVVTGVLLAFNLPVGIPWWIVIIGALVAIGIGKMTFGGLGCNPFNPALTGRIFLLIAYPVEMTDWTTGVPDTLTGSTILPAVKYNLAALADVNFAHLFGGVMNGSMGEISAIALLVGGNLLAYPCCCARHNGSLRLRCGIGQGRYVVAVASVPPYGWWRYARRNLYGYRLLNITYDT